MLVKARPADVEAGRSRVKLMQKLVRCLLLTGRTGEAAEYAYRALAADAKLAEAEYPVLIVVNGSKACRRSAHCSMTSRWRRSSTTSALVSAILTRTAFRPPM